MKRALLTCAALLASNAFAGQACDEEPLPAEVSAEIRVRATKLAEATKKMLEQSKPEAILIARAGIDLSRWKLSWSHAGIALRNHPAGAWTVVHLLNECGSARSTLHQDNLAGFFSTNADRWEGLVIEPEPALQAALARAMTAGAGKRFHEANYSAAAYPYSTKYQNSNQWVMEILANAIGGTPKVANRLQAQNWLRHHGYIATSLKIPKALRAEVSGSRLPVRFDDHPNDHLAADRVDVATVESIIDFLDRTHQAKRSVFTAAP